MRQISTVIIGAGQAGLAMSKCLSDRSVPHMVIERGEVANSWATERWHSLKLLTPNWQSRLPGFCYGGSEPHGYMSMPVVTTYLQGYAHSISAPEDFGPTMVPRTPLLQIDLAKGEFKTVIWATGYRPDFSFAQLPVFDGKGALRHDEGVIGPGLYVLGMPFQRTRKSALIDGVGQDAEHIANHLVRQLRNIAA